MRLLCYQWFEGPFADDPVKLARILGVSPARFRKLFSEISEHFPELESQPGFLANRRLEDIRRQSKAYSEEQARRGRLGAQTRWSNASDSNGNRYPETMASAIPEGWQMDDSASASASASAETELTSKALVPQGGTLNPGSDNGKPKATALTRRSRSYEAILAHLAEVEMGALRRQNQDAFRGLAGELVFAYWQAKLNHVKALYGPERERIILKRLRENGGDVSELLYVVDGALQDDWTMGRDPKAPRRFDEFELLFRDRAHVERFVSLCPEARSGNPHPMSVKYAMTEAQRAAL